MPHALDTDRLQKKKNPVADIIRRILSIKIVPIQIHYEIFKMYVGTEIGSCLQLVIDFLTLFIYFNRLLLYTGSEIL